MKQLIVLSIIFLWSCSTDKKVEEKTIVCTTSIIEDVTKNILPSNFEVIALMGPGVDPHLYKSKSNDYQLFKKASTLINNGLHLEGRLTDVFEHLKKEKPVLSLSDGIVTNQLITVTVNEKIYDPHIWMDIDLMKNGVSHLSSELQKQYPESKISIDSLTTSYVSKLNSTSNYIDSLFQLIPKEQRILITAHDAFSYFGKRHNIQVKSIQGISTVSESGLKEITELIDFIVKNKIPAIFAESSVNPKNINAVMEGCKAKGWNVKIGGILYSDALGGTDSGADTYIKMLKSNSLTIYKGLTNN